MENGNGDRKVTSIYFHLSFHSFHLFSFSFKYWVEIDIKIFSEWNSESNCWRKLFNTVTWMACVLVYFSSIISWFMTHLNKGKQTNSFVPQLSKRVRKCLTHAREHVWGINVAVSVSGNINKRGATCQAAQKEVNIWPDGVQGPISPFSRDLDCLCVCVWNPCMLSALCTERPKRLFP